MSNDDQGWPPQGQGRPDQPSQGSYGVPRNERSGFRESWREEEFGHGQERYYGNVQQPTPIDHASPPSGPIATPPSGSGSKRTGMIAAGAVAAVAVLGGGGFGLYKATQSDNQVAGGGASTSATAPATTATNAPSTAPTSSSGQVGGRPGTTVAAIYPGWQVNQGDPTKVHAAYDVPPVSQTFDAAGVGAKKPIWQMGAVTATGRITDENDKLLVIGHSPVEYRHGHCAGAQDNSRGFILYVNSGVRDPADVNPDAARTWTDAVATKKDLSLEKYTLGKPQQTTVNRGQTPAVQTRSVVPNTEQDAKKCTAPKVEVIMTSFSTPKDTASIVVVRQLGVPDAMTDADLNKILASARPTNS